MKKFTVVELINSKPYSRYNPEDEFYEKREGVAKCLKRLTAENQEYIIKLQNKFFGAE